MADTNAKGVVWILGAGFSMPLGGPSFQGLISWEILDDLKSWPDYNAHALPGGVLPSHWAEAVVVTYKVGLGTPGYRQLWQNAEQFLDCLDIMTRTKAGHMARSLTTSMLHVSNRGSFAEGGVKRDVSNEARAILKAVNIQQLRLEAIRFVAGATSYFLAAVEKDLDFVRTSEQWEPYMRWASKLERGDTVISFNYDRVPQVLASASTKVEGMRPLTLFCPLTSDDADHFDGKNGRYVLDCPLHGNVGWALGQDGIITRAGENVALKDPAKVLMAIPGQDKKGHANKALDHLWRYAMKKIEEAHVVALIGYRFPPTDNHAKLRLLEAMGKTREIPVHIVLGPSNEHTSRVKGMVAWTRRDLQRVVHHDMYAEDFFAVFERERLFSMHGTK